MRRSSLFALALLGLSAGARADDRPWLQRLAERTPMPRVPVEHSAERAGYPLSVSRLAVPSVTRYDYSGYVGGGSVRGNNLCARGPGSAIGPIRDGVYATDYAGVRANLGRLFLAPSADPSAHGRPIYLAYSAEGPRIRDVFAIRPIRNAVLAKREVAEERRGGKEGAHGGAEHGGEAGHAPEGGAGEKGGEGKGGN